MSTIRKKFIDEGGTMIRPVVLLLTILLAGAGCSTVKTCCVERQPDAVRNSLPKIQEPLGYAAVQKRLKTRRDYHQLAVSETSLLQSLTPSAGTVRPTLDVPIYLVGLEKPRGGNMPRHVSRNKDSCTGHGYRVERMATPGSKVFRSACPELKHRRPNLLTHIARFDGLREGQYLSPCLLFSVYPDGRFCGTQRAAMTGDGPYPYEEAISAVMALDQEIRTAIVSYSPTHLLVFSTGWNTQQDESLWNYRDWLAWIGSAAKRDGVSFRPLIVGFSWESGWDKFVRFTGALNKGNDADEIGMTWANRIVNDVVRPIGRDTNLPVVMVGHSYGTRVLGMALSSTALVESRQLDAVEALDRLPATFVALQPAFPIKRFSAEYGKEPYFARIQEKPLLMVMTASHHDKANGTLNWVAPYAGGGRAPLLVQRQHKSIRGIVQPAKVDSCGSLISPVDTTGIYLAEASQMVTCNMPDTGGGAHSDVFDHETGRFIWEVIRAKEGTTFPNMRTDTDEVDGTCSKAEDDYR